MIEAGVVVSELESMPELRVVVDNILVVVGFAVGVMIMGLLEVAAAFWWSGGFLWWYCVTWNDQ